MPHNTGFMIAGYAAAVLILGGYVVALIGRSRAMSRRSHALDAAEGR